MLRLRCWLLVSPHESTKTAASMRVVLFVQRLLCSLIEVKSDVTKSLCFCAWHDFGCAAQMRHKLDASASSTAAKSLLARHMSMFEVVSEKVKRRGLLEVGASEQVLQTQLLHAIMQS